MQTDTFMQLMWIFPVYSVFGWLLEVVYASTKTGKFVNRGFLNGCICPIYGFGACMIILVLTPVKDNLLLLFFGALLFGSLLELVGGFVLQRLFNIRWWDYSREQFNIGGYVCLKFSLAWGVIGVGLLHIIHPPIAYVVGSLPPVVLAVILAVFYIYFVVDMVVTVVAVKKLSGDLEEITSIARRIRKSSDFIAEEVGSSAIQAARRIEASRLAERSEQIRRRVNTAAEDARTKIRTGFEDFERLNTLLNNRGRIRSRLINSFPNMKASRGGITFGEMRQLIRQYAQKMRNSGKV